jgi:hypothetical protein
LFVFFLEMVVDVDVTEWHTVYSMYKRVLFNVTFAKEGCESTVDMSSAFYNLDPSSKPLIFGKKKLVLSLKKDSDLI